MGMPSDQALNDRLEEAMWQLHEAYASVSGSKLGVETDCVWYRSRIPFPVYGGVFKQRFSPESADRRIGEINPGLQLGHWMLTPSSQPADLNEKVATAGGHKLVELKGMLMPDLQAISKAPPSPDGVLIRPANDEQSVRQYARVYPLLFNQPVEGWIDKLEEAEVELWRSGNYPLHRWIAVENGRTVAAGMTSTMGRVAVLQTLCTLEECRNRGIGQSMATMALECERDVHGCTSAAVWAGPGADPLYTRMGFKDQCIAEIFVF